MRRPTLIVVLALLALPSVSRAQDIPESSPEAVAAHAMGLKAYMAQDYRAAIPHFLRAHELDPTFFTPLFVAALNAGNAGMTSLADSLWTVVAANRARFSDYYQRLIDIYVMRRRGGSWAESMVLAQAVARDYPGTKAAYNYAYWSNSDGKPREALRSLATLDPDREPMKGWFAYSSVKCNALHWVGDYEGQLQCARDAVARFPERGAAHYFEAEALAALGRGPEASTALEAAVRLGDPLTGFSVGAMHTYLGLELLSHGCGDDLAEEHLAKAVAWYRGLPADQAATPTMRRQHAYALYAHGDYAAAYGMYQQIVRDLGSVADRAYLGITAGLAGDRAAALEARRAMLEDDLTPRPEVRHFYAALISAALDDRDGAAAHFKQTWSVAGSHTEPVLLLKMGSHPAFLEYLKPRG